MRAIKKILIAEDELLVAKVLKLVLEKNDFEVKHVIDEEDAIQEAIKYKPDLIVLDVYLKNNSSGINAGKKIRKNGMICPIIFTTGNSLEETKVEIMEIENSYLFIKPVDPEQLIHFMINDLK